MEQQWIVCNMKYTQNINILRYLNTIELFKQDKTLKV